jgi:hypothetical protein
MSSGHRRVVHSGNRKPHHDCGRSPQHSSPWRIVVSKPEKEPEGYGRRGDGNQHGRADEQRMVVEVGLDTHRGHTRVVHGHHGEPEARSGSSQARCTDRGPAGDEQRECRSGDRHEPRKGHKGHVVRNGNRKVKREHGDKVHAPDAASHGDAAAKEPGHARPPAGNGDSARQG